MDVTEKYTLLTSMTDETDDSILSASLENAKQVIINHLYPFIEYVTETDEETGDVTKREVIHDMPARYDALQVRIAAYFLNKRGADGQVQHNENNVYRYYESGDVPKSLLDEITPYGSAIR